MKVRVELHYDLVGEPLDKQTIVDAILRQLEDIWVADSKGMNSEVAYLIKTGTIDFDWIEEIDK